MMVKPVVAAAEPTVVATMHSEGDRITSLLASMTPIADEAIFKGRSTTPKINPWLPFVKKSMEGKDAEGLGKGYAIPCTWGGTGDLSASLRKAARELGVSVQTRWTADIPSEFAQILERCKTAIGSDLLPPSDDLVAERDSTPGKMAYRTCPQVTRTRTGKLS